MHQAVPKVYEAYMNIPKIKKSLQKEYDAAGYPLAEAVTVEEMVDNIAGIVPSQIRRSSRPVVKINFTGVFDTVGEIGFGVGPPHDPRKVWRLTGYTLYFRAKATWRQRRILLRPCYILTVSL
jgi:hypothetical protein